MPVPDNPVPGQTSRRTLLSRGALIGGAAAAVSLPSYRALAQDASSESRIGTILDRGKILIGTGSTNPPWHFEDENGKLVGFDIEMSKLLAGGIFGLDQTQILGGEEPRKYIEFVVHEADARIPDLLSAPRATRPSRCLARPAIRAGLAGGALRLRLVRLGARCLGDLGCALGRLRLGVRLPGAARAGASPSAGGSASAARRRRARRHRAARRSPGVMSSAGGPFFSACTVGSWPRQIGCS